MNQADLIRAMSGEERLKQAITLSEMTRELSLANIKLQLGPNASKKELISALRKRLDYGSARHSS